MNRPARAILIGIDEYPENFPTLDSAVQDAMAMENLLKNDLGMTEGITLLTNSNATRSQIIDTILSLEQDKSLMRGEPILVFFSGLAANGAPEGSAETVKIGSICPADVDKAGGISDEALLQLLDRVVRTCGNNITIFLDCTASLFSWGCPASCTIFAPDEADETQAGGAFTQALISAFRERKSTLNQLTPWALRGTIQAFMSNIPVRCWGTNVDRKLFSLQGEQGHYALIQCYQAGDGTIILLGAGTAHGVHTGAVYGAYPSNLKSGMTRLAGLTVRSLNDDNITSVLQVNGETRLPPFFLLAVHVAQRWEDCHVVLG